MVALGPGGRVAAIGRAGFDGSVRAPSGGAPNGGGSGGRLAHFAGGLAIGSGASVDGLSLAANGDVAVAGTRADLRTTDAVVGALVGSVSGRVAALGTSRARYDVGVHVTAARLGPFARIVAPQRRDIAGTLHGRLPRLRAPAPRRLWEAPSRCRKGRSMGSRFATVPRGWTSTRRASRRDADR